jgi:plasmid replication initiation protein
MKKNTIKKSRDISLIKKSNDFIESRYKFDIWEMRFFLSVLSKIDRDDQNFEVYRIKYRDIIKDFGLKSAQSYGLLREGAKSLMKKSVTVNYEENGSKRGKMYHLIRLIDYLEDGQTVSQNIESQEYIDVKVEDELRPYLLQLSKNFTAYDLRNVAKLGTYSIRIYELLKQYDSIGKRTLNVEEIKIMFELTKEYPLFANFYQKVISPAIDEINKFSDIRVSKPERIKDGKKVVALTFRFLKKSNEDIKKARGEEDKPRTLFDYEDTEPSIIEEAEIIEVIEEQTEKDKLYLQFEEIVVRSFAVTPSVFMQLVSHHTAEQIEQAIRVTRRARANAQIKTNVSGYFVKALKEGYTDIKEEQEKKKEVEAEKQRKKNEAEQLEIEAKAEQEKRINDKIREIVEENPNITAQAIELLKDDIFTKKRIEIREKQLGRVLEIQDYRDDKILMNGVKLKIIELEKDRFESI